MCVSGELCLPKENLGEKKALRAVRRARSKLTALDLR